MKLAVSNIAWDAAELADHLALLRDLGCQGVELAPSLIWPEPINATSQDRERVKRLVRSFELEVAGFHALLYSRPDLQLFKDRVGLWKTVDYLKQLMRLCADLEGTVLVFGSPKSRGRNGRDYAECMAWAAEGFSETATEAERFGVTVCIEPLAPEETDFIRTSDEGMELVGLVGHHNFGLQLDAKAMIGANEDLEEVFRKYGKQVRHFHVGDPGLAPPGSTGIDHGRFGRALRNVGYAGYVSIEMRRGFGPTREVIPRSVDYVRRCYLRDEGRDIDGE